MRSLLLLLILFSFLFTPLVRGAEAGDQLLKMVILSRHGVRSPTQSDKVLSLWSEKPWPAWPVARGDLTPRGARLITAMWENLRERLAGQGLLPESGCPSQAAVYVRADTDERTRATAEAILAGLAPECNLGYAVSSHSIDPLFHPVRAGLYRYEAIPAATDVLKMTRGGLNNLQDEVSGPLALIGQISGPPSPTLCSRFALMPKCQLEDLPTAISISADSANIRIIGALGVASSLAEIFLLEYGEWPGVPSGWGSVDARVLSQILPVHSRVFDVVNRAPLVSWANGSSLLVEMTAALFGRHPDPRANEARLVLFVGHDTNLANVGGLLDFYWQASGYPPNGIPPGGALFLELWQRNGKKEVVARFYSQPPMVLHEPFSTDGNYSMKAYAPKAAAVTDNGGKPVTMDAQAFEATVKRMTEGAPVAPAQSPAFEYARAD